MTETAIDNGSRLQISPQETVRQLSGEIVTLREDLARLVAELDRLDHGQQLIRGPTRMATGCWCRSSGKLRD